jgi:hypothetical protein
MSLSRDPSFSDPAGSSVRNAGIFEPAAFFDTDNRTPSRHRQASASADDMITER